MIMIIILRLICIPLLGLNYRLNNKRTEMVQFFFDSSDGFTLVS
jgi:hypothetical protein